MNRVDLRNEEGIGILGLTRQGASPRRRLVADLKALQPFMAAKRARPGNKCYRDSKANTFDNT